MTIIDGDKRVSLKKKTFQGEQVEWFSLHSENFKLSKKARIITVRKTVKISILSSVATIEVHKSEHGMKTNCYKYKKNTIEVNFQWFLTTRTTTTAPLFGKFTPLRPVNRIFSKIVLKVCIQKSRRWHRIAINGFHHCKIRPKENLSLNYGRKWTKINWWKTVANKKSVAELRELSLVETSFLANNTTKMLEIVRERNWMD